MDNVSMTGSIDVTPAIPLAEVLNHPWLVEEIRHQDQFQAPPYFVYANDSLLTVDESGMVTGLCGNWQEGSDQGPQDIAVQHFIDAFPSHQFSGGVHCVDESGNHWAVDVHEGKVVIHSGDIIWPDDPTGLTIPPSLARRLHAMLYGTGVASHQSLDKLLTAAGLEVIATGGAR